MYILDVIDKLKQTPNDRLTFSVIAPSVRSSYPGLFTPFKDFKDAGKALVAPVTDPFILSFMAAACIGKAISAVLNTLTLAVSCSIRLFDDELLRNALVYSALSIVQMAFLAVGLTLVAAAAVPVLALHTITRALTTVASLIGSGFMALVDKCAAEHRGDEPLDASNYI